MSLVQTVGPDFHWEDKTVALPKIIGHRGACAYAPENTLASLKKAAELHAAYVEFDIMLTKDGEAIVMHDETLNRTTNGQGFVADATYAAIASLDAGRWFSSRFVGEKVPTFVEYLLYAAKLGLGINVEIKPTPGKEQETAEKVIEILHQHWPATLPPPLVSSFSVSALMTARALDKQVYLGLLMKQWLDNWQALVKELNCISVNVDQKILNLEMVREMKSCAKYVLAYTVNDKARALQLFAMGVDAVFSNKPDLLLSGL